MAEAKVKIEVTRQCQVNGKSVKPGAVEEVTKDERNLLVGANKAIDYAGKK